MNNLAPPPSFQKPIPWLQAGPGGSTNWLVGDGAMGTELQARGLPFGTAPEAWNLTRPRTVAEVHRSYAAIGAAWLRTNTFGGNRPRLARHDLDAQLELINRTAVHLARQSAPNLPLLGSLGPTTAAPDEWDAAYEEQAEILADAGIDGFVVETIVCLSEGLAAVRAAAALGTGPVIASFTPGPDAGLLDGTPPEQAAEAFIQAGAALVGVNCGNGPAGLLEPARRLLRCGLAPVIAAPNAGLPRVAEGRARYDLTPDAFVAAAIQFQSVGIRFFGGCCGTTPAHIDAVLRAGPITR